jgi:small GTP-binding protein
MLWMKDFTPDKIRNIAFAGHGSTGKTSLAEALLFASGATNRVGKIEDGSTVSDWDPDEQKRQFSLSASILPLEWNDHKVNIVDAPGYMDFMGEVKCALRAVETAVLVVDAVSGVQVGTEFAWRFAEELNLPRAIFINRMDRENADFAAKHPRPFPSAPKVLQSVADTSLRRPTGEKGVAPTSSPMSRRFDQAREAHRGRRRDRRLSHREAPPAKN